jgi:hypothetical protein
MPEFDDDCNRRARDRPTVSSRGMTRAVLSVDRRYGQTQRTTRVGGRAADKKEHDRQRRNDNCDPRDEAWKPILSSLFHLEAVVACAWPTCRRDPFRSRSKSTARFVPAHVVRPRDFRAMQLSRAGQRSVTACLALFLQSEVNAGVSDRRSIRRAKTRAEDNGRKVRSE